MLDRPFGCRSLVTERLEQRIALAAHGMANWGDFLAADNSTRTARNLGSLDRPVHLRQQYVGPFDERDVYQFQLAQDSDAALRLHGMTADADLYLLDSQREIVASSRNASWQTDAIQETLSAGVYFVVVQHYDRWRGTAYSLDVTATQVVEDTIGNTFPTAKNLGSLRGTQTVVEAVGPGDARDVFRFHVETAARFDATLTNLQADVDLHLYAASGQKLVSSVWPQNRSEQINAWIAPGEYFVVVDAYGTSESTYTLSLASNLGRPSVPPPSTTPAPTIPPDLAPEPTNPGAPADPPTEQPVPNPAPAQPTTPDPPATPTPEPIASPPVEPPTSQPNPPSPLADVPFFGSPTRDWGLNAVHAPEAWAAGYTGAGVTVAVIDSGVQTEHPDLYESIWVNAGEVPGDGIDNDGNGYVDDIRGWDFVDRDNSPSDENGHGTHVAGIVAAGNNAVGGTGVAYASTIMPIRVLDQNGSGSTAGVAQGIRYAVDNGAQIINLSLGGGNSQSVYAALEYAERHNVLVVAASGNESARVPGYPAAHSASLPNVLSIGALTSSGDRASFSNRVGTSGAVQVDAPGHSIFSAYLGESYRTLSGTSMATPFVSGVAALAWSANPSLSANLLRSVLTQTTRAMANTSDSRGLINAALAVPQAIAGTVSSSPSASIAVAPPTVRFSQSLRIYALQTLATATSRTTVAAPLPSFAKTSFAQPSDDQEIQMLDRVLAYYSVDDEVQLSGDGSAFDIGADVDTVLANRYGDASTGCRLRFGQELTDALFADDADIA